MGEQRARRASSFLNNVHSADTSNIVSTLVGGAIFNLANLLLVAAIDMAGLAVAFPVSIGIALVVGVVLNFILQPKGSGLLLAGGVICALIAVILDGKAYGSLTRAGSGASRKSIVLCVVSGTLMGLWSPFMTYAMTRGNSLTPYSAAAQVPHVGSAAFLFCVECVFHEKAPGRRAGKISADFSPERRRDICLD